MHIYLNQPVEGYTHTLASKQMMMQAHGQEDHSGMSFIVQ